VRLSPSQKLRPRLTQAEAIERILNAGGVIRLCALNSVQYGLFDGGSIVPTRIAKALIKNGAGRRRSQFVRGGLPDLPHPRAGEEVSRAPAFTKTAPGQGPRGAVDGKAIGLGTTAPTR
jgi:hypothetical protein